MARPIVERARETSDIQYMRVVAPYTVMRVCLALILVIVSASFLLADSSAKNRGESKLVEIVSSGSDWEEVTQLSPEQARVIAASSGITISSQSYEELSLKNSAQLGAPFVAPLVGLRDLTPEVATELGRFRGAALWLSGLNKLDSVSAAELTRFNGHWGESELNLSGLTHLDEPTAKALAKGRFSRLDLSGLTKVSDGTILALSESSCEELVLDGLAYLTEVQTVQLGKFRGDRLALNSLKTLTTMQAVSLSGFAGSMLELGALQTLGDPQAKALAGFSGRRLSLSGVQYLSQEQAWSLGEYGGAELDFSAVVELSAAQARGLARFTGTLLDLSGLQRLNYPVASALAGFAGQELRLNGLTWLDTKQLQLLMTFEGQQLSLTGVTTFTDEQIEHLLEFAGQMIWLESAVKISAVGWEKLSATETVGVVFNEARHIWATDPAKMSAWRGGVSYPAALAVSARELELLAALPCRSLHLTGLRHLESEQARILTLSQANDLRLDNLRALDEATVARLAKARGVTLQVACWGKRLRLSYRQVAYDLSSR